MLVRVGQSFSYTVKKENNGIYLFVIDGDVSAAGEQLHRRDGLAIEGVESLDVIVETSAKLLATDVPL